MAPTNSFEVYLMATAQSVINGALRLIGVLAQGQTLQAEDSAQALEALNAMLATWPDQGIDIDTSPVALADELQYPANHTAPIRYSLAVELAPEYEKQLSGLVMGKQERYFRGLQAYYAAPALLSCSPMLNPYYGANRV